MISSCQYCGFPLPSKKTKHFFCDVGCVLAQKISTQKKYRWFTIFGIFLSFTSFLLALVSRYFLSSGEWLVSTSLILTGITALGILPSFIRQIGPDKRCIPDSLLIFSFLVSYIFCLYSFFRNHDPVFLETSALIIFVLPINHFIDALFKKQSSNDVNAFVSLRVSKARQIKQRNAISETDVALLKKGDIIQVMAGEILPCDGKIISGTTRINESAITGENTSVLKSKGDHVLAGTTNEVGSLTIELTCNGNECFIDKIIKRMLETLAHSPADSKKTFYSSYLALILAIIGSTIAFLIDRNRPLLAFQSTVSLLTIAGMISPLTIIMMALHLAIGKGFKRGVLVRSAEFFPILSEIDTIVFEKTGVLTRGDFVYSQLFMENKVSQETLLSTFFSLESQSVHPLAKGVTTHPWHHEIPQHQVKDFKVQPGLGISGIICERGRPERFAAVGNMRFLRRFQMQISPAMKDKIDTLELMGETVILCGWGREVYGLMSFSDILRPDVKNLLGEIKKLQITPVLITSDHEEMISHLTHIKGLDKIHIRCLPEEKLKRINKLREDGNFVAYVGTKTDDPELLSSSDVGMILNASASDTEKPAGVLLFGTKILNIASIIKLARKMTSEIRFSLALQYGVGITCFAATVAGYFPGVLSILAMMLLKTALPRTILRLKKFEWE